MRQTAICPDKYVGADVHAASTTFVVRDRNGSIVATAVVRTEASLLLGFIGALKGPVHLTFEEGTHAAWLYDLFEKRVAELVVCNPSRNRLLASGNKNDDVDAEKLSELLLNGQLSPVYHGEKGTRGLKQAVRGHAAIVSDVTRVKNRLKAIFRSRGVPTAGQKIYNVERRDEWLEQIADPGLRQRASWLYRELEALASIRREARRSMIQEARKHRATKLIATVPGIGPIRSAQIVGIVATPHRFRSKHQFWSYAGFAVVTRSSSDYRVVAGELTRRKKPASTRGLNRNRNAMLKQVFKAAALQAAAQELKPIYDRIVEGGVRPEMARLTLARKIAAITLSVWKRGEPFDPEKLMLPSGDMTPG